METESDTTCPTFYDHCKQFIDENDNFITRFIKFLEQRTEIPRINIFYTILIFLSYYLTFGEHAQNLHNIICITYPLRCSIMVLESPDPESRKLWLFYWMIFATFRSIEGSGYVIQGLIAPWWLFKCMAMVYLQLPQFEGLKQLYQRTVRPFSLFYNGTLDVPAFREVVSVVLNCIGITPDKLESLDDQTLGLLIQKALSSNHRGDSPTSSVLSVATDAETSPSRTPVAQPNEKNNASKDAKVAVESVSQEQMDEMFKSVTQILASKGKQTPKT